MKKIRFIIPIAVIVLLCQSVHAVVWRSSQIVGYNTGTLGVDAGSGTLDGWGNSTAQVTVTNGAGSLDGTTLGLVASAGDRVFLSTTSAFNTRNQFVPSGTFPMNTVETNIYYSFLYRFRNAADVSTDGEVIIRLNTGNSGTGANQHWDLVAKNVAGQIQLGLSKALGITNYATTNINPAETFFVVVKQQLIIGASNDVYSLWINPPANFFGTNEVDVPPPSATIGQATTDGSETVGSGPGRFVIVAGANSELDEFRVASTWAEATPAFGSCVGAAFEFGPTNVTQVAEISATFHSKALSTATSPAYQWQKSTDNGSTWNNIADATAASHTTPNLALAESGTRYRTIVSVACNNSSATSSVAIVTLTAPTVTLPGLIMHDTFLDPTNSFDDRINPPIWTSNSIWYASVTDDLTAFGQGGNLFGTFNTGGNSRLWLGYFIETNLPPVHLAVGGTIRVTLPFTPNSFASHTNNAGLRFGLFDYADGATRVTNDAAAGGSTGNGIGVRGYMLNLDFGPTFTDTTPLEIYARDFLPDINLMGTTGDYVSLGSGPTGGVVTNVPTFQAGTEYTLQLLVARTAVNSADVTATITSFGGPTWTLSVTDTNYVYHRFDAFGMRPNSLETSADSFSFPDFIVEVLQGAVAVGPFNITSVQALATDSIKLTWNSENGASYHVLSSPSLVTPNWTTNATVLATGSSTSYTNTPTVGAERFYRVVGLPYTP